MITEKHTNTIYKIKCINTGMIYIGATKHYRNRVSTHLRSLLLGKHPAKQMQLDYNKYGKDSLVFSILSLNNDICIHQQETKFINAIPKAFRYNVSVKKSSRVTCSCVMRHEYKIKQELNINELFI